MIYLRLFFSFFQVGLFSFGGGYGAMPFIQNQIVDVNGWLTLNDFADVITVAQITPGPIAVNVAVFVGNRVAGIGGAAITTMGCVIPSCIIVLLLSHFYSKYRNLKTVQGALNGIRPAIIAMIACAGASILKLALFDTGSVLNPVNFNFFAFVTFLIGIVILRRFKANPILIIFGSGIAGLGFHYISIL